MYVEYFGIFTVGFLGGFGHCIGMCGGFVMTYTLKIRENEPAMSPNKWQMISPHLMYNLGRVFTYTILGELFGFLGSTIGIIFAVRHFQGILQLLAGLVMIIIALELSGFISKSSPDSFPGVTLFKKMVWGVFRRVNRRNVFILGMVLGFIPCGLVYVAGAQAAASGSIIGGMLTMLFFGLGTLPAMTLTGVTAHLLSSKLRSRIYKIATIIVFLLAILTVLRGIDALSWVKFYWLF
jgi:sulfite exporter TauE/SafE